jgi:hypothetical protein
MSRQLIVSRLLLSQREAEESIDVLNAIDWVRLPSVLMVLGYTISLSDVDVVVRTDVNKITSCLATRAVLSRVGEHSRGVVPALCTEIVGWFGVRLSLPDVASQYTEQAKSGSWRRP